ncbi:unnamed protein product [Cuscuta europaea]|uniref:Uncharacterized protein n=1 Tax=Cuscuta europaea TaxID=41803 RepID=A0A9P1EN98_CUSEU|nr:unnamed protein product [Cuscuta europaea]
MRKGDQMFGGHSTRVYRVPDTVFLKVAQKLHKSHHTQSSMSVYLIGHKTNLDKKYLARLIVFQIRFDNWFKSIPVRVLNIQDKSFFILPLCTFIDLSRFMFDPFDDLYLV